MKNILTLLLATLFLASCAPMQQQQPVVAVQEPLEEIYQNGQEVREAGSLWQHSNQSMFSDRKARSVGDIVTVVIAEQARASKEATTSTDRVTNFSAAIPNFFGLENDVPSDIDLNNLVNAEFADAFDGNGATTRKEDLQAYLTTQVVGRYPNGQLKIRGGKEVMVNNEVQMIYLTGIIRPVDITA
ncbi:MAG: flagellar basal body L-ring protein FlgH, partial [Desulforhopalus sp.]